MKEIEILEIEVIEIKVKHKLNNKIKNVKIKNNIEIKRILNNKNYEILKIKLIKKNSFDEKEEILIDMKNINDYNYKKYYQIIKDIQDNKICVEIIKDS